MFVFNVLSVFVVTCCVVCGSPTSSEPDNNCAATVSAVPPEPSSGCCGITAEPLFKSFIGNKYPWSALIEYSKNDKKQTLCNGALISGNYVLTAAYCVTGYVLKVAKPENVILGEYDTSHEGADCVTTDDGAKECTDGEVRIKIEQTIPHPENDLNKKGPENNIALIKLAEMAPYTDFIRPICLPSEDITLKTGPINFLKASWGATAGDQSKLSLIKQEVSLPLVPQETCASAYSALHATLGKGEFCAGGDSNKDFCKGDGGSALIYQNGKSNVLAGITNYGPSGCNGAIPTVYVNVYEYNSWIKNTVSA